jgi:hypothetical protein
LHVSNQAARPFISDQQSTHWLLFDIPKGYINDQPKAEALRDFLQICSIFDKRIQFLPKKTSPRDQRQQQHQKQLPPLRHNNIPNPFTDNIAMNYMSHTGEFSKSYGQKYNKSETIFIRAEIQINTYARAQELTNKLSDALYEMHPKTKVILNPLNSQQKHTLGYLKFSTSNINLEHLQMRITQDTKFQILATIDNLERLIDKSAPRLSKKNNVITLTSTRENADVLIKELETLFPIDNKQWAPHEYTTYRKMVFHTRDSIKSASIGTLQTIINDQIHHAKTEETKVTNLFAPPHRHHHLCGRLPKLHPDSRLNPGTIQTTNNHR